MNTDPLVEFALLGVTPNGPGLKNPTVGRIRASAPAPPNTTAPANHAPTHRSIKPFPSPQSTDGQTEPMLLTGAAARAVLWPLVGKRAAAAGAAASSGGAVAAAGAASTTPGVATHVLLRALSTAPPKQQRKGA